MNRIGRLLVHSAPAALLPHLEWAVSRAFGLPKKLSWQNQPAVPGNFRCELDFSADFQDVHRLVNTLANWAQCPFEVEIDPVSGNGYRFSYTVELGLFKAQTGEFGDILVHEDLLREVTKSANPVAKLHQLLGTDWDDILEPLRQLQPVAKAPTKSAISVVG